MKSRGYVAPTIDLRQLTYFLAVADHGSVSAAASILGLTQPSVSEHISRLESKLGVQLVIRGRRGITLTEAGLNLARKAPALLEAAHILAEETRQTSADLKGSVSIGLSPALSVILTVPLTETVHLEHPGIRLVLTEGVSGHVFNWLMSEEVDLGLVYEGVDSDELQSRPAMVEELFVVSAPDNVPELRQVEGEGVVTGDMLLRLPLIMPRVFGTRRVIERLARTRSLDLNIVAEMDSLPSIVEMVTRASGYTILPEAPVFRAVKAGQLSLIKIRDPFMDLKSYLARKRARAPSAACLAVERIMIGILKETIEKLDLAATLAPGSLE